MTIYSEKIMEHIGNPQNAGEIEDANGVGIAGDPFQGGIITIYLSVKNGRLKDVKFKTFGCGAAIAVSSVISVMAKGKTIKEAMAITSNLVADELGGLPQEKMHCSGLGADALHRAIEDYKKS